MRVTVEPAARINLRWIVRLRWGAVVGQAITVLIAGRIVHQPLPIAALLTTVAALAAFNLLMAVWLLRGGTPSDRACGLNLLVDVAELTAVLALSGGAYNPFALLYLVHITIGAVVLPARWSVSLALISVAAYTALYLFPEGPLGGEDVMLLHLRGRWVAFMVAAGFISIFSLRMSQSLRRREAELAKARAT